MLINGIPAGEPQFATRPMLPYAESVSTWALSLLLGGITFNKTFQGVVVG